MSYIKAVPLSQLSKYSSDDDQIVLLSSTDEQPADAVEMTTALGLGTAATDSSPLPASRLERFTHSIRTLALVRSKIAFFGDSMLGYQQVHVIEAFRSRFGRSGGYAYIAPSASGGAAQTSGDYAAWITGIVARLTGASHAATMDVSGVTIEGDTIRVYSASTTGGTFQIQTSKNGAAFANDGSVVTVPAGSVGTVTTITKTDWRATWRVKAVWVSGTVDILGGGITESNGQGCEVSFFAISGSDLNQWLTTPSTIIQPIIASIAPNLCVMSHLDGAAATNTYQPTWQDNINSYAATIPTWLIVGPPVGPSDLLDIDRSAQAVAQRALAETRGDAFWDNREWAGTPAQAIARGLLTGIALDPHYTVFGYGVWLNKLFSDTALEKSNARNEYNPSELQPYYGAVIRRDRTLWPSSGINGNEHLGSLRIANPAGVTGSATLLIEDNGSSGASGSTDRTFIEHRDNIFNVTVGGSVKLAMDPGTGTGMNFYDAASLTNTAKGNVGNYYVPMYSVTTKGVSLGYVEKTTDYAITRADHTVNVTSGSPVITLPTASLATGYVHIIKNSGAGTVTLATTSSQTIDGGAPGSLAAGGAIKLQCTGLNWITIP